MRRQNPIFWRNEVVDVSWQEEVGLSNATRWDKVQKRVVQIQVPEDKPLLSEQDRLDAAATEALGDERWYHIKWMKFIRNRIWRSKPGPLPTMPPLLRVRQWKNSVFVAQLVRGTFSERVFDNVVSIVVLILIVFRGNIARASGLAE